MKPRFQFSIRALFIALVISAIAFAVIIERTQRQWKSIQPLLRQLSGVKYARDYRPVYQSIYSKAGTNVLQRLQSHPDDSIAVQSAWEAVCSDNIEINLLSRQSQAAWFAKFFKKRLGEFPSQWWLDAALGESPTGNASYRRTVTHHSSGFSYANCPSNARMTKVGQSVMYEVGNDWIAIPEQLLQRHPTTGELYDNCSGCFTQDFFFFTVHEDSGWDHDVSCVERSTGMVLWTSRACGCFWDGYTGVHECQVEIVPTSDDRVFVFGCGTGGIYAECLKVKDGKSIFHFSNGFTEDWQ